MSAVSLPQKFSSVQFVTLLNPQLYGITRLCTDSYNQSQLRKKYATARTVRDMFDWCTLCSCSCSVVPHSVTHDALSALIQSHFHCKNDECPADGVCLKTTPHWYHADPCIYHDENSTAWADRNPTNQMTSPPYCEKPIELF